MGVSVICNCVNQPHHMALVGNKYSVKLQSYKEEKVSQCIPVYYSYIHLLSQMGLSITSTTTTATYSTIATDNTEKEDKEVPKIQQKLAATY